MGTIPLFSSPNSSLLDAVIVENMAAAEATVRGKESAAIDVLSISLTAVKLEENWSNMRCRKVQGGYCWRRRVLALFSLS